MHLDYSDLEEAYCQAWHGVCVEIKRGGEVHTLVGVEVAARIVQALGFAPHEVDGL